MTHSRQRVGNSAGIGEKNELEWAFYVKYRIRDGAFCVKYRIRDGSFCVKYRIQGCDFCVKYRILHKIFVTLPKIFEQ